MISGMYAMRKPTIALDNNTPQNSIIMVISSKMSRLSNNKAIKGFCLAICLYRKNLISKNIIFIITNSFCSM